MKIPIKDKPGIYMNFRPIWYKKLILIMLYPSFVYEYEENLLYYKGHCTISLYFYRPNYKTSGYDMKLVDNNIQEVYNNLYEFATRWSNWWPYLMQQNKHYRSLL